MAGPLMETPLPAAEIRSSLSKNRLISRSAKNVGEGGLLLLALQRLNNSKTKECDKSKRVESPATEARRSAGNLTTDPLASVFEIRELDPLPFVTGRNKPLETGRNGSPSGTTHSTRAAARPAVGGDCGSPGVQRRPSAVDRRRLPRRESECAVDIYPFSGNERLSSDRIVWMIHAADMHGQLIDVSMSGVALHLAEPLAPATRIALRMTNRSLNRHVDALAKVLRCSPDADGGWSIVCRFDKNLTFEQIHLIGRTLFAGTIV